MCLTRADGRAAHLTRIHQAVTSLPEDDQRRLGVITEWTNGPHQLTYRQAGYTFGLVVTALAKTARPPRLSPIRVVSVSTAAVAVRL